jgi:hypothetical protein
MSWIRRRAAHQKHSEGMCTQVQHAGNHGGISDAELGSGAVVRRPQEALRFAARRSSRAFVRAAANSAGRFGADSKYTSSGVWPRKAAWGILDEAQRLIATDWLALWTEIRSSP